MTSVLLSEDEKDNLIIRLRTLVEEYRKEIAELEAQVPKVVVPHMACKSFSLGDRMYCDCGELLACDFNCCPHCGAKLNWSEA